MERWLRLAAPIIAAALLVSACASPDEQASGTDATSIVGDPNTDKLAQILARGTLILSTDPAYPPQSYAVEGSARAEGTACSADQMTADEVTGYDAETGKLVADALGVEACFVVPTWTEITGGNWGDRWDISFGSGSINEDRMERLWMTQPYYAVPNYYFVRDDSPYQRAADLDGKTVGACASCSHELYLRGELIIPGIEILPTVDDPQIVTFNTESAGLEKVANRKIDAFLAADPVGQASIDDGLPLRKIEETAFTYYPSGFVDKGSGLEVAGLVIRVNQIIQDAQSDGRLVALSQRFFGADYVTAAGAYDIEALGQEGM